MGGISQIIHIHKRPVKTKKPNHPFFQGNSAIPFSSVAFEPERPVVFRTRFTTGLALSWDKNIKAP